MQFDSPPPPYHYAKKKKEKYIMFIIGSHGSRINSIWLLPPPSYHYAKRERRRDAFIIGSHGSLLQTSPGPFTHYAKREEKEMMEMLYGICILAEKYFRHLAVQRGGNVFQLSCCSFSLFFAFCFLVFSVPFS
ncbi:MAG: hypothetical protein GY714_13185 [Desulfobacterales bacterium]|nr:hypothetical protein [Desulfobacterales bacterium]